MIRLAPLLLAAGLAQGAGIPLKAQPQLVAPGVISNSLHEFAPSLAPDGKTFYFTVTDSGFSRMVLMQSILRDGQWQHPTVLPFSGVWNDGDGTLSPDGKRFVFISNRPATGTTARADLDLWEVLRQDDGSWGEPRRLPDTINTAVNETYPSLAADGTLYFGRAEAGSPIFRSRLVNGVYQPPERMPFSGFSFAIAPDQRFGILGVPDANRGSDLHLVRQTDGKWSAPERLDGPVNTPAAEFAGALANGGRTLLFVSTSRAAQTWPRAHRVTSYEDVQAELGAIVENGLRNIYQVDISALVP